VFFGGDEAIVFRFSSLNQKTKPLSSFLRGLLVLHLRSDLLAGAFRRRKAPRENAEGEGWLRPVDPGWSAFGNVETAID